MKDVRTGRFLPKELSEYPDRTCLCGCNLTIRPKKSERVKGRGQYRQY